MEVERKTAWVPKTVRAEITTLRLPIEDFVSRRVGDHHHDYDPECDGWSITSGDVRCLKPEISCEFSIYFYSGEDQSNYYLYEENEGDLLKPVSLHFVSDGFTYDETRVFYFKVWFENENGEKFWKDKCEFFWDKLRTNLINFS